MKKKNTSHLRAVKPEETAITQEKEMSEELKQVYDKLAELKELPEDLDYLSYMFAKMKFGEMLKALHKIMMFGFFESKDVFNSTIEKEINDYTEIMKTVQHETIKLPVSQFYLSDDLLSVQSNYIEVPIKSILLFETREEYDKEVEQNKTIVYGFVSKEKIGKFCAITVDESILEKSDEEFLKGKKVYSIKVVDFINKLKPSLQNTLEEELMRDFIEFMIESTTELNDKKSAMN